MWRESSSQRTLTTALTTLSSSAWRPATAKDGDHRRRNLRLTYTGTKGIRFFFGYGWCVNECVSVCGCVRAQAGTWWLERLVDATTRKGCGCCQIADDYERMSMTVTECIRNFCQPSLRRVWSSCVKLYLLGCPPWNGPWIFRGLS